MGRSTVTYDITTWVKGDRGVLDPLVTDLPRIINMRLYEDGLLGVRPPWRRLGYNGGTPRTWSRGVPVATICVDSQTAQFYIMPHFSVFGGTGTHRKVEVGLTGNTETTNTSQPLYGSSTDVWKTVQPPNSVTGITSVRANNIDNSFGSSWVTTSADANINTAFSLTNYSSIGSCRHGSRHFFWGKSTGVSFPLYHSTIYYSDADTFNTFSSNTQSITLPAPIRGMASVGSNMLIWTMDGRWYVLQGRGDPATLNLASIGWGPVPVGPVAVLKNTVVFTDSVGRGLVLVDESGHIDDTALRRLYNGGASSRVTSDPVYNQAMLLSSKTGDDSYYFHHGIWVREDFGMSPPSTDIYVDMAGTGAHELMWFDDSSVLAGYIRAKSNEYSGAYHPEIETASDPFQESVEGTVGLPRIHTPERQVRPVRAIVDGKAWHHTTQWTPTGLVVRFTSPTETSTGQFVTGTDPDNLASNASTDGQEFRAIYHPAAPMSFSNWLDVSLIGIENVAIRRVTIEFETSDQEVI